MIHEITTESDARTHQDFHIIHTRLSQEKLLLNIFNF